MSFSLKKIEYGFISINIWPLKCVSYKYYISNEILYFHKLFYHENEHICYNILYTVYILFIIIFIQNL
jgi:hypothetical protein